MCNVYIKEAFSLYLEEILFLSKLNSSELKLEPDVKIFIKLNVREVIKFVRNLSEKYLLPLKSICEIWYGFPSLMLKIKFILSSEYFSYELETETS